MAELKGKQKKFADEYLLSWNAADAARKAGYSEDSAASIRFSAARSRSANVGSNPN